MTPFRLIAYGVALGSLVGAAIVAYAFRGPLGAWYAANVGLVSAAAAGLAVMCAVLALAGWIESRLQRREWERRAWRTGLGRSPSGRSGLRWADPFDRLFSPFFRTRAGRSLADDWRDGFPMALPPYYYLALLVVAFSGSFALGMWVTGGPPLFGTVLGALGAVGSMAIIRGQAEARRQRLNNQLPDILDALANSIRAGFSLAQAISFMRRELAQPAAGLFARVDRRIALGYSDVDALAELTRHNPGDDVQLVVDVIDLQRQVGGNLPAMLEEMAAVLRSRVRLANEIRILSTQGRLSGYVITGLVPGSLLILRFFPGYTDVLLGTIIGQIVLAGALLFMAAGIVFIFMILRVED